MSGANGETKPLPILCAGQGCKDRKQCARFKLRGLVAKYASFDIEREYFDGDCPAFERFRPLNSGSKVITVIPKQYRTG